MVILPSTATPAAAALGLGLGFIDAQIAPHEVLLVRAGDCGLRLSLVRDLYETETFGVTGVLVDDNPGRGNGSVLSEQFLQALVVCLIG